MPGPTRSLLVVLLLMLPTHARSQEIARPGPAGSGFFFGASIGGGMLDITGPGVERGRSGSVSLPNLRFGYMLSDRTAILILLPGNIYRHHGLDATDRDRDRGFEGIIPSVQHWLTDRWWVVGGAGVALDAPAFYDIEGSSERRFYFGPSVGAGAGCEIRRSGHYALDLQARVQYGRANLPHGDHIEGFAINAMVGFSRR